jgi:DNA-binding transcriptional LysR family regulator
MFAWDGLRYFLAFARTGSMLAAAKVLRVNQSTVQRRLAELERELGRKLVTRHGGSYKLALQGRELFQSAERVETAVAAFERDVSACDSGLAGVIRVTTSGSAAERLLKSALIDSFHSRHPHLSVELVVSDRCLDLSKGEADVAIRAGEPTDESLVGRKIVDVPWAIYAAQSYIDRHGAPCCVEELGQHSIVLCDDPQVECPATKWLRATAPGARIVARCESGQDQVNLVQSGAGLAPLLAYQRDNGLVRVIDNISLVTPYYLLMHKDMQPAPKVRAFADFVAAEIKAFRASLFR